MMMNIITRFLKDTLHLIKPTIPVDIPMEDNFKQIWGLDSLDLMEFVARIEQHFSLLIPDEDLEKMVNMTSIVNYLETRI